MGHDHTKSGSGRTEPCANCGAQVDARFCPACGQDKIGDAHLFPCHAVPLASRRPRSGQTFTYSYDNLGRVTTVAAPPGTPGSTYTYNNFSNLLTASAAGRTITNSWDARGRMLSQAGPNGTVSYQYDAANRRTRLTWADGFYVTYAYNTASQLTQIRENGATSGVGVLASFTYDDLGRRTALTRGNGTVTSYDYDAAGRLNELVQNLAGTSHDNTDTFSHNPAGQIVSRTRSNTGYSYASHINTDTLFSHNGLNQITSVTGSTAPSYDTRGNMTSDGTTSFGYDQYNRLTSAGTASFDYDPLGRLYQSTGASGTARRQYDGAAMIAVYNSSGSLTERYVHGPGMDAPLVMYTGSGTSNRSFLHADARGSIIAHTNSSGARTAVLTYDEYGNPGPTNTGRYQYTGQTWLSDAGVYHYKNRAYHPGLMRFMQTDPIGHSGGINLYAYVGGDPVNFTDPWGLESDVITVSGTRPSCPSGSICDPDRIRDFLTNMAEQMLQDLQNWRNEVIDTLCEGADTALKNAREAGKVTATGSEVTAAAIVGATWSAGLVADPRTGQVNALITLGFVIGAGVDAGPTFANTISGNAAGINDFGGAFVNVGAFGFDAQFSSLSLDSLEGEFSPLGGYLGWDESTIVQRSPATIARGGLLGKVGSFASRLRPSVAASATHTFSADCPQ